MKTAWIAIAIIFLWLVCHEHRIAAIDETLYLWETAEYEDLRA